MSSPTPVEPGDATAAAKRRVAFESLRERTDELELIISGISLLALLALPGWLFDHWVRLELHAAGQRRQLLSLAFQLASGLSMTLSGAFLLHLAVRAYWVGLIGLKATFPAGIRWQAIRSIGPITRDYHQRTVIDLDSAIDAADRVASIVFALVSLVALSVLWVGVLLTLFTVAGMAFATVFSLDAESTSGIGIYVFSALTLLVVFPALLLDSAWLARWRPVPIRPWRRALVERLVRLQMLLIPSRLVMPVQLSLESNMPRWTFTAVFLLLVFCSILLGTVQEKALRRFAVVSSYDYFTDSDAGDGLRSAHYESMRGSHDLLARAPMIPSDMIADGHLRVFLPYLPDRDNALLRQRCAQNVDRLQRQSCLAALWQVTLDATPVDMAGFVLAERRDIGQRGLQGYLSLAGLAPGRHELSVRWNASAPQSGAGAAVDYRVPFWFSPPYQQDLAPVSR